ncbi:hypothetical protein L484_000547 [Morus notabilis]|uniref:Uncharacterized protein n=1 Tax=Morus notabilis TaxID=981085 RepID=W9SAH9_9ROSA|nr:hypothetical protein L484_000547 [Morus notabilis]
MDYPLSIWVHEGGWRSEHHVRPSWEVRISSKNGLAALGVGFGSAVWSLDGLGRLGLPWPVAGVEGLPCGWGWVRAADGGWAKKGLVYQVEGSRRDSESALVG